MPVVAAYWLLAQLVVGTRSLTIWELYRVHRYYDVKFKLGDNAKSGKHFHFHFHFHLHLHFTLSARTSVCFI
jgi:hypothetical protein